MSDLLQLVQTRRSIRAYDKRPVEKEKLAQILECARQAPSAGNLQAFEIVVVQDAQRRREVYIAAAKQKHIIEAPLVLIFCKNPERTVGTYGLRGINLYAIQDATIACCYAQLAAHSLGLGTCWVGAFYADDLAKILLCPHGVYPVSLLTIGYPTETPEPTDRRPLSSLVLPETY